MSGTKKSMPDLSPQLTRGPYRAGLNPTQASAAMDAARGTAVQLLESAKILFEAGQFAHAAALAILSIEESGKLPILLAIFLEQVDRAEAWRDYVQHLPKMSSHNPGIAGVVGNLPNMPRSTAEMIGALGPPPDRLNLTKQLALYSACQADGGRCAVHDPKSLEWEPIAKYVMDDATVLALYARHYSSAELRVWKSHATRANKEGRPWVYYLEGLAADLTQAGFIQAGTWDRILEMARGEIARAEAKQTNT